MDLFRRLLGTLQRTVDYLSTFTAYLLGDEAHPGAEGTGITRETEPCRSHHSCEVETEHYGGNLEAFEELSVTETIPPSKEIQDASRKTCSWATEAIHETFQLSCRDERQEDVGQKLSEPPNLLAGAPRPRSSTTGSVGQRDPERPVVTEGLPQRESESTASREAIQQELLEEIADMSNWKLEKLSAGGQEREELGRAGQDEGTFQREIEAYKQEAPARAESNREEQRGLNGAAWTERFKHEMAKMAETLRSEPDRQLVGGVNMEDNQEQEPDIEAGDEKGQSTVPESAESGQDQETGPEGAAETRSNSSWELDELGATGGKESVTEKQRGDGTVWPKRSPTEVAKMAEGQSLEAEGRFVGGAEAENYLHREPTMETGDKEAQQTMLDGAETRRDQQAGSRSGLQWELKETVTLEVQDEDPKGVAEKGDDQQRWLEEAKMEEPQDRQLELFVRSEGSQQREQEENEVDEQEAPGQVESDGEEQRGLYGVEQTGIFQLELDKMAETLGSEPDGQLVGGVNMEDNQEQEPDIEAENEMDWSTVPESAESGQDQETGQEEEEAETRSCSRWLLVEQEATGGKQSLTEEQRGDGTVWPKRSQTEVSKVAEGESLEAEGQSVGGEEAEKYQHREPNMETGDQGAQQTMLEGAKNGRDQQRVLEGEAEARSGPQWEPKEIVTLEVQEVTKMAETLQSEPDGQLVGGVNMEDNQEGELDIEAGDEKDQSTVPESAEARSSSQREPEETVTLEVQEVTKMAETLQLEPDGQLVGGVNMEDNQEEEPDIEAGDERDQTTVPESVEARSSPQWEPGETVTLEVQEEIPEGVAEKGDGQQRWLEKAEMAEPQQRELESFVRNMQQREQEENELEDQETPGRTESDGEEQRGLNGAERRERFQLEVAKMVETLRSEPDGQLVGGVNMEDNQEKEPDIEAGDERNRSTVPESAESGQDQETGPEEEAETRSCSRWELDELEATDGKQSLTEEQRGDGTVWPKRSQTEVSKVVEGELLEAEGQSVGGTEAEKCQHREPNMETGDQGAQQTMLDGAENGRDQQRVLEGEAEARSGLQREPKEIVTLEVQEVTKMAETLQSEPDGQLVGGVNMEDNQEGELDIEAGDEKDQSTVPESAEARSSSQWEPEETVTLEVQEEDPEGVAEKEDRQQRWLEEAEMEEPQQKELEVFVRNEDTQQTEEDNVVDTQEALGRVESDGEEQRGLDGAEWTGRFQPEVANMADTLRSESDGQLVGGADMEAPQQEEPNIEAGDGWIHPIVPYGAESGGDQGEGPEREAKTGSSSWWESVEQEATGGKESLREEQRGDGTAWPGRSQPEVARMVEGQSPEAEGALAEGAEAEYCQDGEPYGETGDEGAQQIMLDCAETGTDRQEAEEGRKHQWEPEETLTLEEHPKRGNIQQQRLDGAEEREGHRHGESYEVLRNEAATEEEERREQMGEVGLEKDQHRGPEVLAGVTILEAGAAEVTEEPKVQDQEPRETEGTERRLLHEPLGYEARMYPRFIPRPGAFPDEVSSSSLDTSAQKERVLLRRKSSVRRAPSLKRARPAVETPLLQEMGVEESLPPPPPASGRPSLRHAGFGPMHPNMMAELQTRLRRPQ